MLAIVRVNLNREAGWILSLVLTDQKTLVAVDVHYVLVSGVSEH